MKYNIALLCLPLLTAACTLDQNLVSDSQNPEQALSEQALPTWDEYVADAQRTYEGNTFYLVEGDMPVSIKELRERYDMLLAGIDIMAARDAEDLGDRKSVVHQHNGADAVWTAAEAQNLTYCVSTNFGTDHGRAVAEMAAATADWEIHAGVDFIYDSSHDSNCSNSNNAVTFAVRSWGAGGGCAFFPHTNSACIQRTLVMDFDDLDNNPDYGNVTTQGVFKHELGHILGLRHEHIRTATSAFCIETTSRRTLTAYDSESVMHYPWCEGATNEDDLYITELDSLGADQLYPRFGSCSDTIHFIDGPYASQTNSAPFVQSSTYLDYPVYTQGSWSIYRRSDGKWYLDFNEVDETWAGTVAYTLSATNDPFSAAWSRGAASQTDTLDLAGGPYASLTNGTFTLSHAYNGSPVYENGRWSIYRRGNGTWYLDSNDQDETWSGTVSHTLDQPRTPWMTTWKAANIAITPACSL